MNPSSDTQEQPSDYAPPPRSRTVTTYFCRECTACGRPLQVSIRLLGKRVACQHCGFGFTATDPSHDVSGGRVRESALAHAERLLAILESEDYRSSMNGSAQDGDLAQDGDILQPMMARSGMRQRP